MTSVHQIGKFIRIICGGDKTIASHTMAFIVGGLFVYRAHLFMSRP